MSLARALRDAAPDCQIVYIGHKGDNFDSLKLPTKDFDFTAFVQGGKFRRYHGENVLSHLLDFKTIGLNIRDFFRVIGSAFASLKILRKMKPDVVFSKGGFVAVPVGLAAKLLRIPIITHDSDSVPGLANRIVGRWAAVNATGMPTKHYHYPKHKRVYVGIPIAEDIVRITPKTQNELKSSLKLPADSHVLLVSGGGNGSRNINELVVSIAPTLLSSDLKLHILHIAGKKHEEGIAKRYRAALPDAEHERVKVLGFASNFSEYSGAADVIIGRAGATSLAEFAAQSKACVIIPSPFLTGGHQLKNAQELADRDAAVVMGNDVSADELLVVVNELLNNEGRRIQLAKKLGAMARPDAAKQLAGIILRTSRGRR